VNGHSIIKVEDVQFAYRDASVLSGVELEVFQGEMLGLVGPNGVGKSTLISVMNGVIRPQRGRVLLNGEDVNLLNPKERAVRVATVPQNPAVIRGFRALDIVMMGRNPHLGFLEWEGEKDLKVCRNVMELTGTWRFADRFITSLSGGERQRVFIARALAQEAQLLMLDEPTAHLDIGFQSEILDVIEEVRHDSGVTVITAMHDMTLAAQYCQRIALMSQGVVYSLGRPEEVLTPENVFEVFGVQVSLMKHPVHGTTVVLPVGRPIHKPTTS
jgi:iron complex transport system ATP-binding protein